MGDESRAGLVYNKSSGTGRKVTMLFFMKQQLMQKSMPIKDINAAFDLIDTAVLVPKL